MGKRVFDLTKLKTSWTKYDIVQVLDVVYSIDTIQKYMKGEASINEAILKSFLGVKSLTDPIPSYWFDIQHYSDKEKKLFALAALLFTHVDIISLFSRSYSQGNMKGVAVITSSKSSTNLRRALVKSGAALKTYQKAPEVPYDFTPLLTNHRIGPLFKDVLLQRLKVCGVNNLDDDEFYELCYDNLFPEVLSLSRGQFYNWLEGVASQNGKYIEGLKVNKFLCINAEMNISLEKSHEVYFLGENGDGKTIILMALFLAFNGYRVKNEMDVDDVSSALSILQKANADLELIGIDDSSQYYSPNLNNLFDNIYAYGTHRGRCGLKKTEKNGFMSLFNKDQELINPELWIKDLVLEEKNNSNKLRISKDALSKVINTLLDRDVKIKLSGSQVMFIEKGYEETFDELSEGYRTVIIFMCDLLSRLIKNNPKSKDIFKTKAVVLIDEIDEHLHLKWQRVIVRKLRTIFPNIQFIMTTHSPTIIQGASDDAIIYRVYRNDGITQISEPYYRKDLNDLMVNTLVTSSMFGLDNSRMDEDNDHSDTSDDYVLYRINKKVREELDKQKKAGKEFLSENEIDEVITRVLEERSYEEN